MDKTELYDAEADALLRAFYQEEIREECAASRSVPVAERGSMRLAQPGVPRKAARQARRLELLAACALLALMLSPALSDDVPSPLAGKAATALKQAALHPLITGLSAGADMVIRSFTQSRPSALMRAP